MERTDGRSDFRATTDWERRIAFASTRTAWQIQNEAQHAPLSVVGNFFPDAEMVKKNWPWPIDSVSVRKLIGERR